MKQNDLDPNVQRSRISRIRCIRLVKGDVVQEVGTVAGLVAQTVK
jgi:hypothetical protein